MMTDKDRIICNTSAYMLVAIRRKKDNQTLQQKVIRRIVRDYDKDLVELQSICNNNEGMWRIYRSVNKRSFIKAYRLFQHQLIDNHEHYIYKIDSLWLKCLMNPISRYDKHFLIDIDNMDIVTDVIKFMNNNHISIIEEVKTPNGYHLIVEPFNVRLLSMKDVTIIKDGLLFIWKKGELK